MSALFFLYVLVAVGRMTAFLEAGYSNYKAWGLAFKWPIIAYRDIRDAIRNR